MELFLLVDIVNKVNRLSDGVIEIGTIESLAPGAEATASITGTFPLQYINLGIPRGTQGNTGANGAPGAPGAPGASGLDEAAVQALINAALASLIVDGGSL